MGGVAGELRHAHGGQSLVHPAADLGRGQPHVFTGKGHVLLHHVGNDLVVRVLKDHARRFADVKQPAFLFGVDAAHPDGAAGGQKNGVEVLCKGGFAAAVVAQHGGEGAFLNGEVHAVQRQAALFVVAEGEVPGLNDGHVICLPSSGWCGRRAAAAPWSGRQGPAPRPLPGRRTACTRRCPECTPGPRGKCRRYRN